MKAQLSFGQFIELHVGTKWVYAQRNSARIKSQYPNAIVILPKQQRELAAAYKKEWGKEYDKPAWLALCALREVLVEYRAQSKTAPAIVFEAIQALTHKNETKLPK